MEVSYIKGIDEADPKISYIPWASSQVWSEFHLIFDQDNNFLKLINEPSK